MQLTKDDILSHSFVISIDEKRLELFYSRMKEIDFNGIKHVIGRLDSKYGAENLNKTVKDILLYSKRNKFPHITIFEDDAFPIKNFNLDFQECINNLPDDATCILLGYNSANSIYNKDPKLKYDNFQNCKDIFINQKDIKKCWGSQAYIIFESDYDRLLKYLDFFNPYDEHSMTDTDSYLRKKNKNFYVKKIPLFIQKNIDNINNIHKGEGNECAKRLNEIYHLY